MVLLGHQFSMRVLLGHQIFQETQLQSPSNRNFSIAQNPEHRNKKPVLMKMSAQSRSRVKLICSYGGRFQPLPGGRRLFYLGGESKLIIVDRSIRLFTLLARLSSLFGMRHDVLLKYRLAGEDPTALKDIIDGDDFDRMMIGHDDIQRRSASAHIFLFLFPVGCCPSKKTTGTTQAELPPLIDLSNPAPDARPMVTKGFPEKIQRQIEELQAGMQPRTRERSPQVISVAYVVAGPDGASTLLLLPPMAVIEGPFLVVPSLADGAGRGCRVFSGLGVQRSAARVISCR